MIGRVAVGCAGGLLLAVAGCAFMFGNTAVEVGVKVNEDVVNDTLDHVAQKIRNEMQRLGLQVVVTQDASVVRIKSTTRSGQKFEVVLTRSAGPQGEQTRIHIDWDQGSDNALWLQLLVVAGKSAVAAR